MKIVKRFLYFILIMIVALCAVIMLCAFNPSLTNWLAARVTVNDEGSGAFMPQEGTQSSTATGVYMPPAQDDVVSPESVKDKNGYEPVQESGEQIGDQDAESLQENLDIGSTGDDLRFSQLMYPYYGMLNEVQQDLYRQIYANALELNTSFAPAVEVTAEQAKNAFEAVYNDHPEIFWLETGYSCKYLPDGKCVELTLQYHPVAANLKEAQKEFEDAAGEIITAAEQLTTDVEKERYVHDALVEKVNYHAGTSMNQSAYSALVNGRSVCAGYARAFQYIMIELGIPCYYCTGYSGEDHAWNIVKLDDGYYNVDVTWDDTTPSTYDYFNKTDVDYAKTHLRKGMSVKLPVCRGEEYHNPAPENGQQAENVEDTETEENVEPGNLDADQLINHNPQKPLEWEGDEETQAESDDKQDELAELGLKEEEIMDNLEEYYADCLKQMTEVGSGYQQFNNVIPKDLWQTIERVYSDGSYEKGYVDEALKQMEMENFAIQLQTERLNGNYYRLYHNISTWN